MLRARAPRVPPTRREVVALAAASLAGLPGLLPSAGGAGDPLALVAWLTLAAPAAGALCGAHGVRLWPLGAAVPGTWVLMLVWSVASSSVVLATPAWAACVVGGLFAFGLALGALASCRSPVANGSGRAWALAGGLLLAGLALSGASVQGGLSDGGTSWARTHPRLAARLLDLSPLVLATDCAGRDWTRAHPDVYAISGVEWFPRRPYRAPLAGSTVLLVGCASALLAGRCRGRAVPL